MIVSKDSILYNLESSSPPITPTRIHLSLENIPSDTLKNQSLCTDELL